MPNFEQIPIKQEAENPEDKKEKAITAFIRKHTKKIIAVLAPLGIGIGATIGGLKYKEHIEQKYYAPYTRILSKTNMDDSKKRLVQNPATGDIREIKINKRDGSAQETFWTTKFIEDVKNLSGYSRREEGINKAYIQENGQGDLQSVYVHLNKKGQEQLVKIEDDIDSPSEIIFTKYFDSFQEAKNTVKFLTPF